MADLSDPEIATAYQDVRDDRKEATWLLLNFENDKSNKLHVAATGSSEDSLAEIKTKLDDDSAAFVYAKISYKNDTESKREKFILITWIGANVKVMRKAKLSVQKADVQQILRQYSIDVPASSLDELDEKSIVTRLRKAGGASYDRA